MKKNFSLKNILAIRSDRFGEFLLNIPAFRALKETYPDARLTLAVSSEVAELAKTVLYADQVVVWGEPFRKALRQMKFDAALVLNPTKEAHWAIFAAGIPLRVGYDRKWGILLNRKMADNKGLGLKHEVESNLELVSLIGANASSKVLSLDKLPQPDSLSYAGAIAVHPYTSDPVKQWPVERFMELARRITREIKTKVVLVGKEDHRQAAASFGAIDLINKTSLVELAQVLKQCRLLVTCDSGPMHLAAAVGVPVVALFRDDLPGKTARRWGPRGAGHTAIERAVLTEISVDEVLEKVRRLI